MQLIFLAFMPALAASLLASRLVRHPRPAFSFTSIRQDYDMNNQTSDNRSRRQGPETRRASVLAAGVAAIALLAAACGGSSTPAASAGGSNYQKAVAFAQCMRSHGEPAFPDPTRGPSSTLAFKITGIDITSTKYQSANNACKKLLPPGSAPAPASFPRRCSRRRSAFS